MKLINRLLTIIACCYLLVSANARELYVTDFSAFPVGEDQLAGNDGWLGSNIGQGVHGIDLEAFAGLGKSAFLGANIPSVGTDRVTVSMALTESVSFGRLIQFQTVFGIAESLERGADAFRFAFHNADGDFLAAIQFDTSDIDFGVWADNGIEAIHTGEVFLTDFLQLLTVTIDCTKNVWSADLDGFPLFNSTTFAGIDSARTIGSVAVEWDIADVDSPGDNWMLLDDWSLETIENLPADFQVSSISMQASGEVRIEWSAIQGAIYQIHHSDNGKDWRNDLPNGELTATNTTESLVYTDTSTSGNPQRLYRVVRLETTP